jgi:hypothetical protein
MMLFYAPALSDWTNTSDAVARRDCEALARALPHGLRFAGLEAHSYCGRSHRIARFRLPDSASGGSVDFVLVPGGEAALGFDGQSFKPSAGQSESFLETAEEYGFDEPINDYVDSQTTTPRRADIPAMLVEMEASNLGVELIASDDPIFKELEQEFGSGTGQQRFYGGAFDGCGVAREGAGAPLRVWRHQPITLAAAEKKTRDAGMRFLTCDEWEYVCGASASTLFRWGDVCPTDCYPGYGSPEEPELGAGWDLHERPNLFGLKIASNPYEMELVADGSRTRGGDGGCNICGGAGFFEGWLPLATAFCNPEIDALSPDKNIADDYTRVRRVIPLL